MHVTSLNSLRVRCTHYRFYKRLNLFQIDLSSRLSPRSSRISDNVPESTTSHRLKAPSGAGRDAVSRCGCVRLILLPYHSPSGGPRSRKAPMRGYDVRCCTCHLGVTSSFYINVNINRIIINIITEMVNPKTANIF
jgi:hypothetical protein